MLLNSQNIEYMSVEIYNYYEYNTVDSLTLIKLWGKEKSESFCQNIIMSSIIYKTDCIVNFFLINQNILKVQNT